jgi:hypothetical protein
LRGHAEDKDFGVHRDPDRSSIELRESAMQFGPDSFTRGWAVFLRVVQALHNSA